MYALVVAALLLGAGDGGVAGGMELVVEAGGRVRVLVEDLSATAKENGADEGAMRTQIEAALRRCGLLIAEGPDPGVSLFYSSLGALPSGGGHAAALRSQVTRIERVRGRPVVVHAWSLDSIFTGPPGSLGRQVRGGLEAHLDDFCNEYLKNKQAMNKARKK